MIDVFGMLTLILEVLSFIFAFSISYRLLRIYWSTLDDMLGFLGFGFAMISLASIMLAFLPLVETPTVLTYLYLSASLMDAFGCLMILFSYIPHREESHQVALFTFSIHVFSLILLSFLAYKSFKRKSFLVSLGFIILALHHIVEINSIYHALPEIMLLSEALRPIGLLTLFLGLRVR
ncbi:MAG: hypothetical protein QXY40_07515 [Candidatus Methanomethylicia archaeon]